MTAPPLLPTVDASLNALSFVLLVAGMIQIKRGNEAAHKRCMIAALTSSTLFLVVYLYHHASVGLQVKYAGPEAWRNAYLGMLLAHTILAVTVPVLAGRTAWLGFKDRRATHRRWARVALPVWLFVSVTGVLIYLVLYVWTDSYTLAMATEPSAAATP